MEAKRVLFYLEPVTYADSPLRLSGWWNFFSTFAIRSAACFTSQIAAAPALCALDSSVFEEVHAVDQIELLRSSGFDRVAYSRDLCQGFTYRNRLLLRALERLKQACSPDIIISVTDNRYLKKVFGQDKVMFMELGPLPRCGMKHSIYVDPYGHQINSALDKIIKAKWEHLSFDVFADIWRRRWVEPIQEAAQASGLTSWLSSVRENKKILLAALQPSDWTTYEGIGPAIDPVSILRRLADTAGDEWVILPQWHSSGTVPSDDLMDELSRVQQNILHVPAEFRIAQSEYFLPSVDGVATISSNVVATGAIMGKDLSILGRSKFHRFDAGSRSGKEKYDLLAFLSCRYCRTLDDFLLKDGAFADHILRLNHSPQWLLDPNGIEPSQLEAFFSTVPTN